MTRSVDFTVFWRVVLHAVRAKGSPKLRAMLEDERQQAQIRALAMAQFQAVFGEESEDEPLYGVPAELWTKRKREQANLEAMRLVQLTGPHYRFTPEQRQTIATYSGWGGLSIKENADRFPSGLVPDESGLIHEYYTPSKVTDEIARVLKPLVATLPRVDGEIHTLEPSAGIGRFVRSFSGPEYREIAWHVVEFSHVSATMLQALRPDLDVFEGPFEQWVTANVHEMSGKIGLVLSNPPYGERGPTKVLDPVRSYRERAAYAYFMRRGLDLLAPNGLGVFLVPAGFMTGTGPKMRQLRETVLRRHHLSAAFRLPSKLFPGAALVVDLLFFRARGVQLDAVLESDTRVLDGLYFRDFPGHILGVEKGKGDSDDDIQTAKPRWGYQVEGTFERLPDLIERPMDRKVAGTVIEAPVKRSRVKAVARKLEEAYGDGPVAEAINLGVRVDQYLARVAGNDESVASARAELIADLETWVELYGAPRKHKGVHEADMEGSAGAARFLAAFTPTGEVIAVLREPPTFTKPFQGDPSQAADVLPWVYRPERGGVTFRELGDAMRKLGGSPLAMRTQIPPILAAGSWCVDGEQWDRLVRAEDYYTGDLWPKFDRADAYAQAPTMVQDGLVHGAFSPMVIGNQARKLREAIAPMALADIVETLTPQQSWIPVNVLDAWAQSVTPKHRVTFAWEKGLLVATGGGAMVWDRFCGWANQNDKQFDVNDLRGNEKAAPWREKLRVEWTTKFRAWLMGKPEHGQLIERVYNRSFRGYVAPTYGSEPLDIARWDQSENAVRLKPHQNAGARRVLHNRRGLLAFDVGVGKTFTGIAIMARARQEGWVRRPVIVVPNTLVWAWERQILRVLPDYRVGVVGSVRTKQRADGTWGTRVDKPEERAAKWTTFQAGGYDCMIVTRSMLERTQLNHKALVDYIKATPAIERVIEQANDTINKKLKDGKKELTEREQAVLKDGAAGWLAEKAEIGEKHEYDPGIAWDDIGVDMMIVDEAQGYKNLYMPEARDGSVPKFMGGSGSGSRLAWQLDFRAAAVRKRTGGSGIVLLSATPAKNSPLEFYNLVQFVDHDVWVNLGITGPEQFIDRYLRVETIETLDAKLRVTSARAVVGFQNLPELRDVLFRYAEFKTAEEVGLELPKVTANLLQIKMDARQDALYDEWVKVLEELSAKFKPEEGEENALSILGKLSAIATHPEMHLGMKWKTADEVTNPHSPKFDELARRVAEKPDCGHIVFIEMVAAHAWIRTVLIRAGVPEDRIAIMNGDTANPSQRQRIADLFNGPPTDGVKPDGSPIRGPAKYDVVIANSVAYEGIDLQVRTCAIHHLDLPWEPATLQQRNGRGVRQGNETDGIEINYYLSRRSTDGMRFALINGKHGWMKALLHSQERDTNNPAAQASLSQEDMLLMIARKPSEVRKRLRDARLSRGALAQQIELARAGAKVRNAFGRIRQAGQIQDPEQITQLRAEAEVLLRDAAAAGWPYAHTLPILRGLPADRFAIHPDGYPLIEGSYLLFEERRGYRVGKINGGSRKVGMGDLWSYGSSSSWSAMEWNTLADWHRGNRDAAVKACIDAAPPIDAADDLDTGPPVIVTPRLDESEGRDRKAKVEQELPVKAFYPRLVFSSEDLPEPSHGAKIARGWPYAASIPLMPDAAIEEAWDADPDGYTASVFPSSYASSYRAATRKVPVLQDGRVKVELFSSKYAVGHAMKRDGFTLFAPTAAGWAAFLAAYKVSGHVPDIEDAVRTWFPKGRGYRLYAARPVDADDADA